MRPCRPVYTEAPSPDLPPPAPSPGRLWHSTLKSLSSCWACSREKANSKGFCPCREKERGALMPAPPPIPAARGGYRSTRPPSHRELTPSSPAEWQGPSEGDSWQPEAAAAFPRPPKALPYLGPILPPHPCKVRGTPPASQASSVLPTPSCTPHHQSSPCLSCLLGPWTSQFLTTTYQTPHISSSPHPESRSGSHAKGQNMSVAFHLALPSTLLGSCI